MEDLLRQLGGRGQGQYFHDLGLGVEWDSGEEISMDQVRKAHRKAVLELHPDKYPADIPQDEREAKMARLCRVQEAYEKLGGKKDGEGAPQTFKRTGRVPGGFTTPSFASGRAGGYRRRAAGETDYSRVLSELSKERERNWQEVRASMKDLEKEVDRLRAEKARKQREEGTAQSPSAPAASPPTQQPAPTGQKSHTQVPPATTFPQPQPTPTTAGAGPSAATPKTGPAPTPAKGTTVPPPADQMAAPAPATWSRVRAVPSPSKDDKQGASPTRVPADDSDDLSSDDDFGNEGASDNPGVWFKRVAPGTHA